MKTMSKKLASIVLALCLCFSLVGTALAANDSSTDESFTITITNAATKETYTAYKIFDVTYSDVDYDVNGDQSSGNYAYSIKKSDPWYEIVSDEDSPFSLTKAVDGSYIVSLKDEEDETSVAAFFNSVTVPTNATPYFGTIDEDGNVIIDVTSGGPGYYFVTTTLGSLVMVDTTDPTPTIEEKNGTPTLDKKADHVTDDNAEMVEYTVDITDITGAENLILHDYMDSELSLQVDETTGNYKITVTLYPSAADEADGTNGTVLVYGSDYTVSVGSCTKESENCTFEVNFTDYDFSNYDENYVLAVVYDCDVDTTGDEYSRDEDILDNVAHLTYGVASSSNDENWDVYLFGFEVYKYTGDDVDTGTPLSGVEFEMKASNDESANSAWFKLETVNVTDDSGVVTGTKQVYLFEGYTQPDAVEGVTYTQTLTTNSDGMIYIEGLDVGTYYLFETKTLDGYNMLTSSVTVTITAETNGDTVTRYVVSYEYGDDGGNGTVNIVNNSGSELPGTGGMGTTIFYIIGGVLVAGAVVVLITRRRMSSNEG